MDCILIGFSELDLEQVVLNFEQMRRHSGAYLNLMHSVGRFHGKWMHYTNILNTILSKATGKEYHLHPMEMPSLGLCYLKSFLAKRNFDVEMINFFNKEKDRLERLLRTSSPNAVAITTTFYITDAPIIDLVGFIRKINQETQIIIGGPRINTLCLQTKDETTQDYFFEKMGADIYINSSQGELTLSRTLDTIRSGTTKNLLSVPNLIFRSDLLPVKSGLYPEENTTETNDNQQYVRTMLETEKNDLDTNRVDCSYFPDSFFSPTAYMRTSRGCPFSCAFCNYPSMAGSLTHSKQESIAQEMQQLHEDGVKYLTFIDDTFNVPLVRFKRILKMMIANDFKFNWFSFFRCSHADDEAFDLMQESGCKGVFLGIESGDQTILNNMNKKATVDHYKTSIKKLHDRDIFTFASLIVGFPGETEETVQNTISFLQETRPTFFKAGLYFHAHHVPIHQQAGKYGLKGSGFGWSHNTMNWQKACEQIELIYSEVTESQVCPIHMFDFWTIPYLLGKGLSLTQIKKFLTLCRPIILRNFDQTTKSFEQNESFLELGKEIALTLQLRN